MSLLDALDQLVGQVVAVLPDGTEYRQVLMNPSEGEQHVTPDGRTWVAVHEQVVAGVVSSSPFTIHWKGQSVSSPFKFSGRVIDSNNIPISGASIAFMGQIIATTAEDGTFSAPVANAGERISLVFSAPGFVSTAKSFNTTARTSNVIVIWPIAHRMTFDPASDLDVELGGTHLRLPAGTLLDAQGAALKERAQVAYTLFDVSDARQRAAAPGDYSAINPDGTIQRLESFGIFDLDIRALSGQPVTLADGAGLAIAIPVPPRLVRRAPRKIGHYVMDAMTARWVLVGHFLLDPPTLTYNGTITRLGGAGNLDTDLEIVCVTIRVVTVWNGQPLANMLITAEGPNWISTGTTNASGLACLLVGKNQTFTAKAEGMVGSSSYGTPVKPTFQGPNFNSGASDCGNSERCPLLGTIEADLIVGIGPVPAAGPPFLL
jgi:hypothetical protein